MIVAGERSGDIYGAGLARALQARLPGLAVFGCGGEAMRQAAVDTVVDAHQIAITGGADIAFHVCVPNLSRPQAFCDLRLPHAIHRQDGAVLQVIVSPT
jgi:lipid A disaccharide synthetase